MFGFKAGLGLAGDENCVFAGVADHVEEGALPLDELVGRAHFDDPALLHDDDLVVVRNGVEAVGDGDDGGVAELLLDGGLDEAVSLHVHVRGRLVEHQELVPAQERPGQAEQLLLAHREGLGGVRDVRLELLGELNKPRSTDCTCS